MLLGGSSLPLQGLFKLTTHSPRRVPSGSLYFTLLALGSLFIVAELMAQRHSLAGLPWSASLGL